MMRMLYLWLLLALVPLLSDPWPVGTDDGCFSEKNSFFCVGDEVRRMPAVIPSDTTSVLLKLTKLTILPPQAFWGLNEVSEIMLTENGFLEEIGALAFANLSNVVEMYVFLPHVQLHVNDVENCYIPEYSSALLSHYRTITASKYLAVIHKDAFWDLPNLRYLSIMNTGLKRLPDFTKIHSAAHDFVLDFQDNLYVDVIPPNAFLGMTTDIVEDLRLSRNGITEVQSHAFNGTKMTRLFLMGNQQLRHIHSQAFTGAEGPGVLDISQTAVSTLPENMLHGLKLLRAVAVQNLKKLPRGELFTQLVEANLTYPSHCCTFANLRRNTSTESPLCSLPNIEEEQPRFFWENCQTNNEVSCFPKPDAFNPCEDIMGSTYLRVFIWLISMLAIAGNLLVLAALLSSHYKLTMPRFLMCNLAFADLCIGVYLLIIAAMDNHTRSQYYNYGIDWQTGPGCTIAGFITVFASELSVYTLTVVALANWHIMFPLLADQRTLLRHARAIMTVGWVFALLAAVLPVVGVSSYSKVSICLPMDVETTVAQVYVVGLLLLNVLAFLVVCICYLRIYLTLRNPNFVPPGADIGMAQRMAMLIFTNFLCMAPISIFAILAALKLPLITMSHAKVLLVFFYPINSCSNPFLYVIFTKTFKRDFFFLASRFGFFKARALVHCTEMPSPLRRVWVSTRNDTLHSLESLNDFR
ncbi:lutropin-choriogonadotropic hormone receptor-like isoform X1 [Scleropages formosus]|uniref:lutropin-choriogonadotropic hormone receptor-like isoform X1 n=1 Tax=Scleropages formosus TaxID=113540 RepID=UPI0010FAB888|nr:lutropin-choriogonadotropic hormone receptor-like isoform X1 [Scleropages formosus]